MDHASAAQTATAMQQVGKGPKAKKDDDIADSDEEEEDEEVPDNYGGNQQDSTSLKKKKWVSLRWWTQMDDVP